MTSLILRLLEGKRSVRFFRLIYLFVPRTYFLRRNLLNAPPGGGGYSHTLPIRVCAAQRGRDFDAPDLERGVHFRGVF